MDEQNKASGASTSTGEGQQPGSAASQPETPPAAGGSAGATRVSFSPEQQAYVDSLIAQRISETKDSMTRKQREDAQKKSGEFQKLYEEQQPEVVRLQGVEKQYQALEKVVKTWISDRLTKIPEALRPPIPEGMPLHDQLAWIDRVVAFAATAPQAQGAAPPPGNGPSPRPANSGQQRGDLETKTKQKVQGSGMYRRF